MPEHVLANRLAALATALEDAVEAEADDLSASAVAALQTIRQDGPMAIQDVARTVGITHSATVRLIDRLEKDWLVRRLSRKGREVRVEVTARGRRRAAQFQEKRLAIAQSVLDALPPEDYDALTPILDRLLAATVVDGAIGERTCRSCDREGCRKAGCPVTAATEKRRAEEAAKPPAKR